MAQQFDYPKTETDLRATLDALYQTAKAAYDGGQRPAINGLIEIMSAQATIITAIHNIKSNKGSKIPGVDGKIMERDYLRKPFQWVISDIQSAFQHCTPKKIRREYIDKPGKAEKRPLGIPTIRDRIVQECIRIVLEPILEAQFLEHSYGFRPMRDTHQALERVTDLVHTTGYHWIVEGDISKCFDKIDHRILLKRLYHVGIHDRRVIQIVKAMLEAGIIGECEVNEEGVSQGSVLSPLLANLCLDMLDEWVSRQWERKERGLINYYQNCTWVNLAMDKHRSRLRLVAMHWLKAYKGKWIPANKTQNLVRIHEKYRGKIPAVEYKGMFIGVTDLTFVRWQVIGRKKSSGNAFYRRRTRPILSANKEKTAE